MKTECQTILKINDDGSAVFKNKKQYETLDAAISKCKELNAKEDNAQKLISYKCGVCHKYHIGRNNKLNTIDKKRKVVGHVDIELPPKEFNVEGWSGTFKLVGKIDLDQIKYKNKKQRK